MLRGWINPRVALVVGGILLPATLWAGQATAVTDAKPATGAAGVIRIWGHGHRGQDYIRTLLTAWEKDFQREHPEQRFENSLLGNASALAGLSTGVADLAVLDREASFVELDAFDQVTGHAPLRIPVATGSVATVHHAPAAMLYVNRANPLEHLTVVQLDAIFDADHRRSGKSLKTWGDLGLSGDWAARPIMLYGYDLVSSQAQFFERAAMQGSQKWSCCLKLFRGRPGASAEAQIDAALAKDKYGLALSGGTVRGVGIKPVALAAEESGPFVQATPETLRAGSYPLGRTVSMYVDRAPKTALEPRVAAFLDYLTSARAQAIAERSGGYLALSPATALEAKERLR